ncbi:CYFA0S07e03422g1_1 [Cyberlindnera fabianii]|uniref:CYFA0S07e03422g1_1 n=1 Tax=Cyberlindnera fabianii TaxID=36022 RepID=A0A061B3I5_CYBFA|nr:CYFA0S07e03422g1_1 [Cyberlindnera fabianii]
METNASTPLASGYMFRVELANGTVVLYSYSCSTSRLTLTLTTYDQGYDSCVAIGVYGYWYNCNSQEQWSQDVVFRPNAAIESSEFSSMDTSSASISSSSSEQSSSTSLSSSTGPTSSSVETSSSAAESSSVEVSSSSAASSSAADSSTVVSSAIESSAIESSADEASSSSAVVSSSAAVEPSFEGSSNGDNLNWILTIPGQLGPWTSVTVALSRGEENPEFDFKSTDVEVRGIDVTSRTDITITDDSVSITIDYAVGPNDPVTIDISALATGGGAWTINGHIEVTTADGTKLVKRATISFDLSDTITADAFSSDGIASSEERSSSSTASDITPSSAVESSAVESSAVESSAVESSAVESSAIESSAAESSAVESSATEFESSAAESSTVESSSTGFSNTTSTTTEDQVSTTVITVTSCSDNVCTEAPVTTGVTVVTTTSSGVVTEYTTYCPLPTSTDGHKGNDGPSTTVVTVTSCDADSCTETAVTTGVTVITTTEGSVETVYTTYCPLSSEVSGESTHAAGSTGASAVTTGGKEEGTSTATIAVTSTITPAGGASSGEATTSGPGSGSTVATVSTFEGAGVKLSAVSTAVAGVLALLFLA